MSADLSQELRRHDAIKQLIDDAFTVIHLEDRQGKAKVALIIEAHFASQLKEEVKRDAPRRPCRQDPPTSKRRAVPGG